MAIYLPDFKTNNELHINGNLSGITNQATAGYQTYYLQLFSRYSNRNIDENDNVYLWSPKLVRLDYNDRYTTFEVQDFSPQISEQFKSGIMDYTVWGSYFDIDNTTTPFYSTSWEKLDSGLAKLYTQTTHDMQISSEAETVKYTDDNEKAQSYIIYND